MKLVPVERQAVFEALDVLDPAHPARFAAETAADPIALMRLVERDDVLEALQDVWFAAYRRQVTMGRRSG